MDITNWLLDLNGSSIYPTLFFMLIGGALGLPIPEDVPLILGGVLAHQGRCSLDLTILVAYIGTILGDMIIFSLGYKFGPTLYKWKAFRRYITPNRADRINRRLSRHSLLMIFVARHLFYLRTATFLTCGLFRMSLRKFIIADLLAAAISVPAMIGLGYWLSENFELLTKIIAQTKLISLILAIICLLVVGILIHKRLRRRSIDSHPHHPGEGTALS